MLCSQVEPWIKHFEIHGYQKIEDVRYSLCYFAEFQRIARLDDVILIFFKEVGGHLSHFEKQKTAIAMRDAFCDDIIVTHSLMAV